MTFSTYLIIPTFSILNIYEINLPRVPMESARIRILVFDLWCVLQGRNTFCIKYYILQTLSAYIVLSVIIGCFYLLFIST